MGRVYDTLVLLSRICGGNVGDDFMKVVGLSCVTIRCCERGFVRDFGMIPVLEKTSVLMYSHPYFRVHGVLPENKRLERGFPAVRDLCTS